MAETGYKIPILKQDNDKIQIWLQGWDEEICNSILFGNSLLAQDHPLVFSFWTNDNIITLNFTFDSDHIINNAESLYSKLDSQYIGEKYKYIGPDFFTIDYVNRNKGYLTTNTIYEVAQRPGDKKCIFICYNDNAEYIEGSNSHTSITTQIGFPYITTMNREYSSNHLNWKNVVYTYYEPFIYTFEKTNLFSSFVAIRFTNNGIWTSWPEEDSGDIYLKSEIYSGVQRKYISTINYDIYYYNQNLELTQIPKPAEYNPAGNLSHPYFKNTYFKWNMNPESIVLDQYDYFHNIFENDKNIRTATQVEKGYFKDNKNSSTFYLIPQSSTLEPFYFQYQFALLNKYKTMDLLNYKDGGCPKNIFIKYNPIPKHILPCYQGDNSKPATQWGWANENLGEHGCVVCTNPIGRSKYTYKLYKNWTTNTLYIYRKQWTNYNIVPSDDNYKLYKTFSCLSNNIIIELQGAGGTGEGSNSLYASVPFYRFGGGGGAYVQFLLNLEFITEDMPLLITLSQTGYWYDANSFPFSYVEYNNDTIIKTYHGQNIYGQRPNRITDWVVDGGKPYIDYEEKYSSIFKTLSKLNGKNVKLSSYEYIDYNQYKPIMDSQCYFSDEDNINSIKTKNIMIKSQYKGNIGTSQWSLISSGYLIGGLAGGASVLGNGTNGATYEQAQDTDPHPTPVQTDPNGFGGGGGGGSMRQGSQQVTSHTWAYGSDGQPSAFILHW